MYRIRKQGIDWAFFLWLSDVAAVAGSFFFAFWISSYIEVVPTPEANRFTVLNCVFFGGLTLNFFIRFGLYRWEVFVRIMPLLRRLPIALAVTALFYVVVRLLVAPELSFEYFPFVLLFCGICFFFILASRGCALFVVVHILRIIQIERIAFIGWSKRLGKVLEGLAESLPGLHIMEGSILDESRPDVSPPEDAGYRELGSLQNLKEILVSRKITTLVVDQGQVAPSELRTLADLCADEMVNLRMIPSTFDIWAARLVVRIFSGVPLIGIKDLLHDRFGNRILKRFTDILGSLVGLAISAPIIAVLTILIRRESPGPIFFRQTRLGLRGKPFEIFKLRSMKVNAEQEKGAVWAVENDPRRLKIGAFMRKWNLDELPQFWNVLRGEMTLVGPRPERPEFVFGFRETVRYYNLRHSCKPGLTGWAAVHGLRGNTSLEDRLEYDLYYIENWSLFLDFKIMFMTLAPPKNAY